MSDSITLRMATEADAHLPAFDFTKLSAVNSCPRWGIIRYTQHKSPEHIAMSRNMALEAGSAMHQCFSAIRLWQLRQQGLHDLAAYHTQRLFGAERAAIMFPPDLADGADGLRMVALECLQSSGFEDSLDDKRRTYSNLETTLLYYCQHWDHMRYPVWVRDPANPTSDVGIEIPFAVVIEHNATPVLRYTGRVDGIHVDRSGELVVVENKTASRLGTAWRMSFETSHQVTGYCVAASLFTAQSVERAMVLGTQIPLPRTMSDGFAAEPLTRRAHMWEQWLAWVSHTVNLHDKYARAPLAAPMYTHSCNRYFSPCPLIPLCAGDPEEQRIALSEMVEDKWDVLEEQH